MSAEDTDDEAAAGVADSIRAHYALPPLTDDQRAQRELDNQLWRDQQQWRAEQDRLERERIEAAKAEARQREAAIAAKREREKARRESRERLAREVHERELRHLHFKAAQHESWQRNVETAARNAVVQQQRNALNADLEASINPPASPPEPAPSVIYIEASEGSDSLGTADFNPKLYAQPKRWG